MSFSVLIASGKGGVGKSVLTANLGAALARQGFSVVIIDADIGLRSQDTLLGLENAVVYDLIDVLEKQCSLEQALLKASSDSRLNLLPASQFARARDISCDRFRKVLKKLKQSYNYVLIDSPAGIEKGFRNLLNIGAEQTIIIATPDDICIRDAERTAQILESRQMACSGLVVNRLDNDLIRNGEMLPARVIADSLDIPLFGEIPEDPAVYRSVLRHGLFIDYDCPARGAVLRIACRLTGQSVPFPEIGTERIPLMRRFFQKKKIKEVTPIDRY